MSIDIPAELFSPTVEELEDRTSRDLAEKWKPSKRPGKKERDAIKREKEVAKIREIANEFSNPKQAVQSNNLSSLFVQSNKPIFSLAAANASFGGSANLRPTLRVSVEKTKESGMVISSIAPKSEINDASRKRGRPPKVNPL